MDETHLSTFHSISNSAQEKRSKNSISSPVRFVLFFFHARDCTMFTLHNLTDFLRREGTANHIKIIGHSCFHNHWPTSKTKLNENLFESKGTPWCFGGPTQLAYSAYREELALIRAF